MQVFFVFFTLYMRIMITPLISDLETVNNIYFKHKVNINKSNFNKRKILRSTLRI